MGGLFFFFFFCDLETSIKLTQRGGDDDMYVVVPLLFF